MKKLGGNGIMTKRVLLLILLSSSSSLAQLWICNASEERVVGVSVGDGFQFEHKIAAFGSDDPYVNSIPSYLYSPPPFGLNRIFLEMQVMEISETAITFQIVYKYENGTRFSNETSAFIDVKTGVGWRLVIASNLDVNETIYEGDVGETGWDWRINETVSHPYLSGMRETNHLNLVTQWSVMENGSRYEVTDFIDRYWDRETGVLVEDNPIRHIQRENYKTTVQWQWLIVDSSRWVVPEFLSFLILPLFMIMTLLAVSIYRRRKHGVNTVSN